MKIIINNDFEKHKHVKSNETVPTFRRHHDAIIKEIKT